MPAVRHSGGVSVAASGRPAVRHSGRCVSSCIGQACGAASALDRPGERHIKQDRLQQLHAAHSGHARTFWPGSGCSCRQHPASMRSKHTYLRFQASSAHWCMAGLHGCHLQMGAWPQARPSSASSGMQARWQLRPAVQGPLLEAAGKDVGVVTHIMGPSLTHAIFNGSGGHAGGMPMGNRRPPGVCDHESICCDHTCARACNLSIWRRQQAWPRACMLARGWTARCRPDACGGLPPQLHCGARHAQGTQCVNLNPRPLHSSSRPSLP